MRKKFKNIRFGSHFLLVLNPRGAVACLDLMDWLMPDQNRQA